MSQLLVRKLDEDLIAKIKKRAAENGVSVEEEHRRILKAALDPVDQKTVSFRDHLLQIPVAEGDFDEDIFERDRSTSGRATEIDWASDLSKPPLYTSIVAEPDSQDT